LYDPRQINRGRPLTVDVHTSVLGLLSARLKARALIEVGFRRILVLDETRLRDGRSGDDTAEAHDRAPRLRGLA
jgi:hypothetical protein